MEISERIFADSNYFIALFSSRDALYDRARACARIIAAKRYSVVISSFIFLETVTVLSYRRGKEAARDVGTHLRTDPAIQYVHVDESLQETAWDIFQRVPEKNISFVDCSTIAVMKAEHITTVLTFDTTDFRKLKREYKFAFFQEKIQGNP